MSEEIKSTLEYSFPSWIDIRQKYGIEIIGILQGHLEIPKIPVEEDLLQGSLHIQKYDSPEYSFPCRINIQKRIVQDDLLLGWLSLEKYYPPGGYSLLFGNLEYEKDKKSIDLVQGHVRYSLPLESNLLQGKIHIDEEELDEVYQREEDIEFVIPNDEENHTGGGSEDTVSGGDDPTQDTNTSSHPSTIRIKRKKHEFEGKLKYEIGRGRKDLLMGSLHVSRDELSRSIQGSLRINREEKVVDIEGRMNYEQGLKKIDLFSSCTLDKDDVVQDILEGHVALENEDEELDLLHGHLTIAGYYAAADFACRVKVNKKRFVHSIFSRIDVPPSKKVEIPCTIEVDGENRVAQVILQGSIEILKENLSVDLIQGKVSLLPTIHADIDCSARLNPVYMRKEFEAKVNVVHEAEFELPATVEVTPPADYWLHQEILYCKMMVGSRSTSIIPSTINVQGNKRISCDTKHPSNLPRCRIGIAVSPTWRYEAFVFKSCLITFLDRYFGKVDLDIVFGGSPRADFDIFNLALNYKIRRSRLHNVPIEVDFKSRDRMQASVNHFIRHMIFDRNEQAPLDRVFIFMNQPSWYYNDPVGKIAQFCKDNQIPCVCIDSGGDYHEILDIDRARDDAYNQIEFDRQQRMHPNYKYEYRLLPHRDDPYSVLKTVILG